MGNNNSNQPPDILASLSRAIVDIANKVAPSVVSVHSKTMMMGGSGVVWNVVDGHIVTCAHVIKGVDEVKVGFSEYGTFSAKVVGSNRRSDLALLKIETDKPLKSIEIGDSENLKAGQFVLALDNPFGDQPSVTSGIITSARSSIGGWGGRLMSDIVITDARLNPGYSGGPLVDVNGKMIGLNAFYISSRGIAVRIGNVKSIIDQLAKYGKIKRAYLGITSNTVFIPKDVVAQLGITQDYGLMVLSVEKDTPAKKAGLVIGDVIIKFDNESVTSIHDIDRLLAQKVIGKQVKLLVLREEKLTELTITPGEVEE